MMKIGVYWNLQYQQTCADMRYYNVAEGGDTYGSEIADQQNQKKPFLYSVHFEHRRSHHCA